MEKSLKREMSGRKREIRLIFESERATTEANLNLLVLPK